MKECYAAKCKSKVGKGMLMCSKHWFKLPKETRQIITEKAWKKEFDKEYVKIIVAARDFIDVEERCES